MSLTAPDAPDAARGRRWMRRVLVVSSIASAVLVVALLAPQLERFGAIARRARPHLPDLDLFAAQSSAVQIHILVGLAAIGLGAVLMLVRKGRLFHRVAGWTWTGLVTAIALSSLFIVGLNGDRWSFLHLFSGWVLVFLPLAVFAARRHRVVVHKTVMTVLFYGTLLITAALAFLPGRLMWNMVLG